MPNCRNCGAPLPPNSYLCRYCRSRNDIDLTGIPGFTTEPDQSERPCPRCRTALATINLKISNRFLIDRCAHCLGLFFDPGELEYILDNTVKNVFDIDYRQLTRFVEEGQIKDYPVTYIKCPVCGKLMNRINFGAQSGVVADRCKEHGVWLDGGELHRLMEWVKAGGKLFHQQVKKEEERLKEQREKQKQRELAARSGHPGERGHEGIDDPFSPGPDIFSLLERFVSRLFS